MWPSDQKAKDHGGFGRTIGKNATRIQVHTHSIYIYIHDIYIWYIYMIYIYIWYIFIYIYIHLMLHTYVWHYLTIYCHPSLFRGGGAGLALTPKYFSKKNLVYIYIYTVESGTGGCGQVHANQLKRTFPCFFSPQALLEKFLRGAGAKPWHFTALEATPPEIPLQHKDSVRFWESSKTSAKVWHP